MFLHSFDFVFFFNDTATTEIYTLSLHDALPIWAPMSWAPSRPPGGPSSCSSSLWSRCCFSSPCSSRSVSCTEALRRRSEEHTSELQSRQYLVCRLLLEKKNNKKIRIAKVQELTI